MHGSNNKRRWLQFSLRGLLALMLLACVGLGVLVHRAKLERQRIADLEALGVKIHASQLPPSTNWLRGIAGNELLGVTYSAHLTNTPTLEQFMRLQKLSNLNSIQIKYDDSMPESEVESTMNAIERKLPRISITLSGEHSGGWWISGNGYIRCDSW